MLLAQSHPHPRDANITFKEKNHEYTIAGMSKKPTSVTTLIHSYFPSFDADKVINKMMSSFRWKQSKYYGRSPESIKEEWSKSGKEASDSGTLMHRDIERFFNGESVENADSSEYQKFTKFWSDITAQYPTFRPYRTEWLIYDENAGVAGSIDCVLSDGAGNLIILDWKRSKEIKMSNKYEKGKGPFSNYDNCNYSHYSLQLNFYRHILESKYNQRVSFMMLVILHPDQPSYICYPVPRIDVSQALQAPKVYH